MEGGQGKTQGEDNITTAGEREGLGKNNKQHSQLLFLVVGCTKFAMRQTYSSYLRSFSLSPATDPSLPPPSAANPRFLSIEPLSSLGDMETSCVDTSRIRKNTVTGAERQLLDRAGESILDYTLFRDLIPSALEFTGFIHSAWTDSEAWHDLRIEPSTESLNNASTRLTKSI